jgi:septal ring factor EnvC (AmiA/AmiB activator)
MVKTRKIKFVFTLLVMLLALPTINAQKKDNSPKQSDLQQKKKKINEDIKNLNAILDETKTIKNITMLHVQTLNLKISARQELIQTINAEIRLMSTQINKKQKEIDHKSAELDTLKQRYKKMIYYAYRNRESYNKLMFVFAASDFNQAYERIKYMQEINDKRRQHANTIIQKQTDLSQEKNNLLAKIEEKKSLLTNEEQEKVTLTKEKGEQEETLSKFATKEKQIKEELDQKKKDALALDKKIKEMIEEVARKAREQAEKERLEKIAKAAKEPKDPKNPKNPKNPKVNPENPKNPELTKEAEDLSDDFASNKGKLPWPVTKGVITEGFGTHEHPKIKGFEYVNNGVDITTSKGGIARAVFDGEVTGVANMPDGNGKFLIIRHGGYLSVYTNLSAVYVKSGDKIKVKQNIGEIDFSEEKGGTVMNLQIWKGQVKLNPEDWLYK